MSNLKTLNIDPKLFTLGVPENLEDILTQVQTYLKDTATLFSNIAPILEQLLLDENSILTKKERISIIFILRRMR